MQHRTSDEEQQANVAFLILYYVSTKSTRGFEKLWRANKFTIYLILPAAPLTEMSTRWYFLALNVEVTTHAKFDMWIL
jgi:hypothetical protein